uniref:Putative secreted protein n=1 Tax=Anopheles marajoara TaxID=58244 RepID=A0A2M4C8R5_9DIPT
MPLSAVVVLQITGTLLQRVLLHDEHGLHLDATNVGLGDGLTSPSRSIRSRIDGVSLGKLRNKRPSLRIIKRASNIDQTKSLQYIYIYTATIMPRIDKPSVVN